MVQTPTLKKVRLCYSEQVFYKTISGCFELGVQYADKVDQAPQGEDLYDCHTICISEARCVGYEYRFTSQKCGLLFELKNRQVSDDEDVVTGYAICDGTFRSRTKITNTK